jgi:hypothetical protein
MENIVGIYTGMYIPVCGMRRTVVVYVCMHHDINHKYLESGVRMDMALEVVSAPLEYISIK